MWIEREVPGRSLVPEQVSDPLETSRWPDVAVRAGDVVVGYVVLSDGDVEVRVEAARGAVWVSWTASAGALAYRVRDPLTRSWGPREVEPLAGGETEPWLAREAARARIRHRVLRRAGTQ